MSSAPAPPPADSDHRLAAGVVVRVLGGLLVLLALLLVVVTLLVALAGLPTAVLVVVAVAGLAAVLGTALLLTRGPAAVHLGADGYRVRLTRLVRGVGVASGGWREVAEAVTTTTPAGLPVVVLKLTDGRSTTIPVALLAGDREDFVRDLQRHLQHGQGLRPL